MSKKVFFLALLLSLVLQGSRMWFFDMADTSLWGHEAQYFLEGDARAFDISRAYGYPAGPLIEGTVVFQKVFNLPWDRAVAIFTVVFSSILTALISLLVFLLTKRNLLWLVTVFTSSLSQMYEFATPPSAIVSLLIVFLFFLAWYFYENRQRVGSSSLLIFSVFSGLALSTRLDIAFVFVFSFFLYLIFNKIFTYKKILFVALGASITFFISNPFMWFMPVQHLKDLVYKIVFQYADFLPNQISVSMLLTFSFLSVVALAIGSHHLFSKQKFNNTPPDSLFLTILIITSFLYLVFTTASYQAPRYFMPTVLLWEVLLPFYLLSLVPSISFIKKYKNEIYLRSILEYLFSGLVVFYSLILIVFSF